MVLTEDNQVKILEVLRFADDLPAIPPKDIITVGKQYYSPAIAMILKQDLSDRQHDEVVAYLDRIKKLQDAELDAIDRLAIRSAGRGDFESNPSEMMQLRSERYKAGDRIRQIMGLPTRFDYIAAFR